MITKKSKVYVSYLYMQIKCRSITFYIKNKTRGGAQTIASKGTLHFKYVFK